MHHYIFWSWKARQGWHRALQCVCACANLDCINSGIIVARSFSWEVYHLIAATLTFCVKWWLQLGSAKAFLWIKEFLPWSTTFLLNTHTRTHTEMLFLGVPYLLRVRFGEHSFHPPKTLVDAAPLAGQPPASLDGRFEIWSVHAPTNCWV